MQKEHAWAEETFGDAALGDARRTRRLVLAAAELCGRPAGRVTQVYRTSAEREGAFRLLENSSVDPNAIARASHRATARRCATKQLVCVALDQTSLSVTDDEGTKFGRIGNTPGLIHRGIHAMGGLAIDEQSGTTLGTIALEYWVRKDEQQPRLKHKNDHRPEDERESIYWKHAISSTLDVMRTHAPNCTPWFQMDRGADNSAVLLRSHKEGLLVTVRATHDRALNKQGGGVRLWSHMKSQQPLGSFPLHVSKRRDRPARIAHLIVRAARISAAVARPTSERRTQGINFWAVHVKELGACETPIEWMLWTTYPVKTFGDAQRVIHNYSLRWRIEDFHRAWKSGVCNIESSQLRSVAALQRWGAMTAAVAARAEHLKHLSRTDPERPALRELTQDEVDAVIILSETKKHKRGSKLSLNDAVLLIAQVGGYTGKSSGGPPGAVVIARGLRDVEVFARGLVAGRSG